MILGFRKFIKLEISPKRLLQGLREVTTSRDHRWHKVGRWHKAASFQPQGRRSEPPDLGWPRPEPWPPAYGKVQPGLPPWANRTLLCIQATPPANLSLPVLKGTLYKLAFHPLHTHISLPTSNRLCSPVDYISQKYHWTFAASAPALPLHASSSFVLSQRSPIRSLHLLFWPAVLQLSPGKRAVFPKHVLLFSSTLWWSPTAYT